MRSRTRIRLRRSVGYLAATALLAGGAAAIADDTPALAQVAGAPAFVATPATRIAGPATLGAAGTATVQVAGRGGVPASGVRAALVNVTASAVTAQSTSLTVWPSGSRPATSNLHAVAGQTGSTSMVMRLSDTGAVSIYNSAGSLAYTVDVQGYFADSAANPAGGFVATAPARVLDTRVGTGGITGKVPAGGSINVRVAGVAGSLIPADAKAVFVMVGVASPGAAGRLKIATKGTAPGTGSALEFSAGTSVQNGGIAVPDGAGYVTITNTAPGAAVDVLLTTQGYFTQDAAATDAFNPASARVFDSRADGLSTVASGQSAEIALDCVGGLPGAGMSSVLVNVMVLNPTVSGGVRIWPADQPEPTINTVIFREGVSTASLIPVRVSENGGLTIRNSSLGTLDIVVDVQGYFADPALDGSGEPDQSGRELRYSYRGANALAGTTEITTSTAGQQALADLRDRQAAGGELLDTTGYRVYNTSARDGGGADQVEQLVLPPDLQFHGETVSTAGSEGSACMEASITIPEELAGEPANGDASAQADDIVWVQRRCTTRQNYAYWFDTCYKLGRVRNDGTARQDFWVLKQYGTCKSKGAFGMKYCGLGGKKKPGSPTGVNWDDWAPRADSNGSCRDISLSVSAGPVGIGGSYSACERVDITKYRPAPMFSNYWRYGLFFIMRSERDVEYQVTMVVAQGRTPPLYLWWSVGWGLL